MLLTLSPANLKSFIKNFCLDVFEFENFFFDSLALKTLGLYVILLSYFVAYSQPTRTLC
jgi:hypothetical protein